MKKITLDLNPMEFGMLVRAAACQLIDLDRKIKRAKRRKPGPQRVGRHGSLASLAATAVEAEDLFKKLKRIEEEQGT